MALLSILVYQSHAGMEWDSKSIKLTAEPGESFVEVKFVCRNAGKDSIVIEKIQTACSCTSAVASKLSIGSGEQGIVAGRFDFGTREGIQRKRFVVLTSGGGEYVLNLTVDIPRTYSISPRRLTWTSSDNPAAKSCRMINESNVPIKIAAAKSSSPAFKTEIREIRPGFEYEILVAPAGKGASNAIISIATEPPEGHKPRTYQIHAVAR
jgi:hypothetical protein